MWAILAGQMSEEDKWKCLVWISGLDLTATELKTVPIEFLVDVIVCTHLVKAKVMKLIEAACLMRSIEVSRKTEPSSERSDYPHDTKNRPFQLGFWYMKVFFIFHSCIGAVGLKCFQVS